MRTRLKESDPRLTSALVSTLLKGCDNPLLVVDQDRLRLLEANSPAARLLESGPAGLVDCRLDHFSSLQICDLQDLVSGRRDALHREVNVRCASGSVPTETYICSIRYRGCPAFLVLFQRIPARSPGQRSQPGEDGPRELTETNLDFPRIVGQSSAVRKVCRLIGLVAKNDTTVLVEGESGTGKELVAEAIHFHSRRSHRPLVKVNCAALAETLLESELFGHKKGAFTGALQDRKGRFQLADRGTLVLDEIGSMPLAGQAKLLRVLQEREFEPVGDSRPVKVDVRVIAVTNVNLKQAINQGDFRQDLYYRLSAFPIPVPPLKQRKIDIPLLARHFLRKLSASQRKEIAEISLEAISMLMEYDWPGNVRELENTIEYAAILEKSRHLRPCSLPDKFQPSRRRCRRSLRDRLQAAEKQFILEALSKTNWVKSQAAELLGIDRRNLSYFLRKHDMQRLDRPGCN